MYDSDYIILATRGILFWASNLKLNVRKKYNFQAIPAFRYSQDSYPPQDRNIIKFVLF